MSNQTLPPPQGPEYTRCGCGHIEPEHRPDAGPCLVCDCVAYLPAVLPAVPVPPATHATDRAAVLRDAADAVAAHPGPIPYRPQLDEDGGFWWDTRDRDAVVALLRRMADEAQQQPDTETRPGCTCSHPDTEHSIYGCADGCACEWMPKRRKRPPMDPVHILGIEAASSPGRVADEGQPETREPSPTEALLVTRCDACRHTLTRHHQHGACTVVLCVCGTFQYPVEELPQ